MPPGGDLSKTRVVVLVATIAINDLLEALSELRAHRARFICISPDGFAAIGLNAIPLSTIDPLDFDGVLLVCDSEHAELFLSDMKSERLLSFFFDFELPVACVPAGTLMLGQMGLLEHRVVSCDDLDCRKLEITGAVRSSNPLTVDGALITANSRVTVKEITAKFCEVLANTKGVESA